MLNNIQNSYYLAEDFNNILEKKFNDNIGDYPKDISCLKYNDLILEFDKIFEEKYFSESPLDLLYNVYCKYSICNVILYPLFAVYEKYRRKEERWSEICISQIEKSVYKTHSYIESYETVKNIIMELNKTHLVYEENSLISHMRGYLDKSVEKSFFTFVTNFIKRYHLMYCALFDVTCRSTKRNMGLACGYIVQNHVKISDQEFLHILDWAESKIVFDGYTILSDSLIENMRQIHLPLIPEDNWIVNKEALALVFTYKREKHRSGIGDVTFPIDKMYMCAMTCNTLEEYISNTRNELKNVDYLQLDETEKNIYKNVIVINHFFDIYEFGLDMPETFTKETTKSTARNDFYNEYLKKEIKKNSTNVNINTSQVNSDVDDRQGDKSESSNDITIRDILELILCGLMYIAAGVYGYSYTTVGGIGGVVVCWIFLTLIIGVPILDFILVAIIGYAIAGSSGLIVGWIGLVIIKYILIRY